MNRIGWLAAAALLLGAGACSGAPSGTSGQGLNETNVDRGLVGTHQGGHDGDAEHEDAEAEHEDAEAEHAHGDAGAEREDAEAEREGAGAEHEDAEAEHENQPDADGDHGGRGPHSNASDIITKVRAPPERRDESPSISPRAGRGLALTKSA